MDVHKGLLLLGVGLGAQADEPLQRQTVQRLIVGNAGEAEIQIGQTLAGRKAVDVFQLVAVGQLQPGQLLAVFKAYQFLGGAAGGDHHLQIGHTADEAQVSQILVVTDVHVFDPFAVFHGAAGVIGHVVHRPEGVRVGEQIVPAVHAEIHPPDHVGAIPEVLPDFGQHLVVQLAVVQDEPLAAVQHRQSLTDLAFPFVADGLVFVDDFLVGGGNGLAEEGEAVVEHGVGGGVLEFCHLLEGLVIAQGHVGQPGENPQLAAGLRHLLVREQGQGQGGGIRGNILPQQGNSVFQGDIRIGTAQGFHLLRRQIYRADGNGGQIGQIFEAFQQCLIGVFSRFQPDGGSLIGNRGAA